MAYILFFISLFSLAVESYQNSDHKIDKTCRLASWIERAVVFQSVEAPQIEPLWHQYEDQQGLPYGDYDLVRGKPAVALVDVKGLEERSGLLQAFVDDELYFEERIQDSQTDFPIDLPMGEGDFLERVKSAQIRIRLTPDDPSSCYDETAFKVTVWETKKLDLKFAKINNRNCKPLREYSLYNIGGARTYQESYRTNRLPYWPYQSVSSEKAENFKLSKELSYLSEMLPLSIGAFHVSPDIIDLEGHCDNRPVGKTGASIRQSASIGFLEDINALEKLRIKQKGVESKVVAIIPKDYFSFHHANSFEREDLIGSADIYGFVLSRREYLVQKRFFSWSWISSQGGGSSHVLFVREDSYQAGTLSHELSHTLGQKREFYDFKQKCRDFYNEIEKECPDYKMKRSLKFGKIEKDLTSLMHSGEIPIDQKWIDRETYQKIFAFLLTEEESRRLKHSSFIFRSFYRRYDIVSKSQSVDRDSIVIISGIYLKSEKPEEEKFLYEPKIEIHKEGGLLSPFVEEGDIKVELKLGGELIYTHRLSSFAEIEFLRRGEENRTAYELSSIPLTVSLPLKHGAAEDYEVVIKKIISDSEERVLFSSQLPR